VTDDEISTEESPPEEPKRKKGRKAPAVFARPPFANEVFTDEMAKVFNEHPGYSRHFVKQYLLTGNIALAAKQAGIQTSVQLKSAEETSLRSLIDKHISPEDIIVHLNECLKADVLIRDKHGNMHKTVDLKIKLQTIELISRLRGDLNQKKQGSEKDKGLVDMFGSTDPESKD
jgi:hypothetical protein